LLENVGRAVTTCIVLETPRSFALESLTDPAVHRAVLANLAAEKLPNRHTEDLALDVPEGDVDTEPCKRVCASQGDPNSGRTYPLIADMRTSPPR
jgi:hypothetical protein